MSSDKIMTPEEIEQMLMDAGKLAPEADAGQEEPIVDVGGVQGIPSADGGLSLNINDYLNPEEQDVLGEVGNICMGTAATTLYTLLGRNVNITTPKLSVHTLETLQHEYPAPIVVIEVRYIEGIEGNNLLLLKEYDVALITDLLMGGDGSNVPTENIVLDEIQLSAIREVMNQMIGSSATSLADMIGRKINISTPQTKHILISEETISDMIDSSDVLVKVAFSMEIEDALKSEIMQVIPWRFAKNQAKLLLGQNEEDVAGMGAPADFEDKVISSNPMTNMYSAADLGIAQSAPQPSAPQMSAPAQAPQPSAPQYSAPPQAPQPSAPQYGAPAQAPAQAPQYAPPPQYDMGAPYGAPGYPNAQYAPYPPYGYYPPPANYASPEPPRPANVVRGAENVKEVQYPSLNAKDMFSEVQVDHLGMLMDVPMKITVQLGETKKTIKEIMELNTGSVVVLDKLAGEYVEILANGVQIAKGEVVVIDDNYGVRITEINLPENLNK